MKNSIILGLALSVCIGLNNTAEAGLIGNDVIDRERNDTWTNFTTIDKSLKFTESGVITDWSIWSGGAGDIFLQVFRHVSDDTYTIVGENYFNNVTEGFNTWSVEATQQIEVSANDFIGFSLTSSLAHIDYDVRGNDVSHSDGSGSFVTGIGSLATLADEYYGFGYEFTFQDRTYSISAETAPAPVPEPATMLLFGTGLAGMAGARFRKKQKERC